MRQISNLITIFGFSDMTNLFDLFIQDIILSKRNLIIEVGRTNIFTFKHIFTSIQRRRNDDDQLAISNDLIYRHIFKSYMYERQLNIYVMMRIQNMQEQMRNFNFTVKNPCECFIDIVIKLIDFPHFLQFTLHIICSKKG